MGAQKDKNIDLKTLWEAGVPLDKAWIKFATFFDDLAHRALHVHPDNDADVLDINDPRYIEMNRGWLPRTWEGRQKKLEIVTQNERANLLWEIYDGSLFAVGFRTLDDGSDELVRVPRQYFFVDYEAKHPFPDINWNKGEITIDSRSYFDIRVAKLSEQDSVDHPLVDTSRFPTRKGGRPNTRKGIEQAIRTLIEDPEFRSKSRRDQAIDVRAHILGPDSRDRHDWPNYKTETIMRILGEIARQ